ACGAAAEGRGNRRASPHIASPSEAHRGRHRPGLQRPSRSLTIDDPMRIALCADGRISHSQRWANGVADRGHDVSVVWASQELAGSDLSGYRASVSHHPYVRATPQRRPWMLPFAPLAAHRLARLLKPDLVHGLFLSGHGWTAHALRVRPLVLSAL